jgi:flagellar export protein FliJ
MKSFHFTLEALGTLRRRQEQKAMEQYAQSLIVRLQAVDRLKAVEHELGVCWQEWRSQMAGGCAAVEAAQAHAYHLSLIKRREECALALETAERRLNATLQGMTLVRQQREIVDKCFDRQKARHRQDQVRSEQKFLDDLAGRRGGSIFAWKPAETLL